MAPARQGRSVLVIGVTMDEIMAAEMLIEHGYTVRGRLPSGWVLRAPDGRLIREGHFVDELEQLTGLKP